MFDFHYHNNTNSTSSKTKKSFWGILLAIAALIEVLDIVIAWIK